MNLHAAVPALGLLATSAACLVERPTPAAPTTQAPILWMGSENPERRGKVPLAASSPEPAADPRRNPMALTVADLLDVLENADPSAELRLVTQPGYPLESHVASVVTDTTEGGTAVLYLAEGAFIGYGSREVWG